MAIDEAILEEHLLKETPPTLRLYGFAPKAVSLGYAQKMSRENLIRIESEGFSVVRRPTGGRAVLHANDLTYSFVALSNGGEVDPTAPAATPVSEGTDPEVVKIEGPPQILAPSVQRAYKQISMGLIVALSKFGIKTELGKSYADYRSVEDCFAQTTQADLHYKGKKLVGSAQLRRKNAVLQHGSIILSGADTSINELLADSKGNRRVDKKDSTASLKAILGKVPTIKDLNAAFKAGFAEAFQQEFEEGSLTPSETERAEILVERYRTIFW
jgi:lipoate-protein ligase A